jgi:hypothetical protein
MLSLPESGMDSAETQQTGRQRPALDANKAHPIRFLATDSTHVETTPETFAGTPRRGPSHFLTTVHSSLTVRSVLSGDH